MAQLKQLEIEMTLEAQGLTYEQLDKEIKTMAPIEDQLSTTMKWWYDICMDEMVYNRNSEYVPF